MWRKRQLCIFGKPRQQINAEAYCRSVLTLKEKKLKAEKGNYFFPFILGVGCTCRILVPQPEVTPGTPGSGLQSSRQPAREVPERGSFQCQ